MTDLQKISLEEQNVEEAIASLKNWSYLLRYGRMGKPRFCPFRISDDETTLMWCIKREEKQLPLSQVYKFMPGQQTAAFQRYPQPEKENQSFSLLYNNYSLDVICKDKGEAETWLIALQTLISRNSDHISKNTVKADSISSDGSTSLSQRNSSSDIFEDSGRNETFTFPINRAFSDAILCTESIKPFPQKQNIPKSYTSQSSTIHGPRLDDVESLHDVFIWGEGTGDGLLGGGMNGIGMSNSTKMDSLLPKALKRSVAFDARKVSCGSKHAVLVTKQGEVYSWGEGFGGRLGHGMESDIPTPKLIDDLSRSNVEMVACGEHHTCALTQSGDLYTWGEIGDEAGIGIGISHWIPRKVGGQIESMNVKFISCGPWHSAAVTSEGLLFTFGDGSFGALGHGDNTSIYYPKPVESLKGLKTIKVSCGVWHTAAIVEVDSSSSRKLFAWGNGDNGQLGHEDRDPRFLPSRVVLLDNKNFCQVACGHSMTIALTNSGHVYTIGTHGIHPVKGKLTDNYVQEISCGSHHIAILTSKSEVYTWGKGTKGQLGHGDNKDRETPTLVEALSERRVKSVVCGSNATVAICLRKEVRTSELPMCSSCNAVFNFKRKRHNCYNCGLVFCKACSSKKSLRASLAPNADKYYRVCEDCYSCLHKEETNGKTTSSYLPPKSRNSNNERNHKLWDLKSQGLLSRISAFDSFRRVGSQLVKPESSQESSNNYVVSPLNSSPSLFENPTFGTSQSQAASPVRSSFSYSNSISSAIASLAFPETKGDDSKRKEENLMKEISTLREQVEYLTQKAQIVEADLKKTSIQLKEATKQVKDEEEKNKAANVEITSLTTQVENLTTRIGQGCCWRCRVSGKPCIQRQLSL
ncbi:PH, RCC1 and FYVE domains-containing protein 1 isoform X1 [Lactuca sativa]|nr:PH, RCC1 and FYVE domains-containing protein 1 isoform X1 [Lactuca sativa]